MSDELKPCPWEKPGERHELEMVDVGALAWVRCATCMAAGPCENGRDKAVAAWNARAAVTDEQFSLAVHDGEAWQRVRTCRPTPSIMNDVEHIVVQRVGSSEFQLKWPYQRCSECSADFPEGSRYCPGCGAKVVAE